MRSPYEVVVLGETIHSRVAPIMLEPNPACLIWFQELFLSSVSLDHACPVCSFADPNPIAVPESNDNNKKGETVDIPVISSQADEPLHLHTAEASLVISLFLTKLER